MSQPWCSCLRAGMLHTIMWRGADLLWKLPVPKHFVLTCLHHDGIDGLTYRRFGKKFETHGYVKSISSAKCLLLTTVSLIHGCSFLCMTKCYVNMKRNVKAKPAYQSFFLQLIISGKPTLVCHSKKRNIKVRESIKPWIPIIAVCNRPQLSSRKRSETEDDCKAFPLPLTACLRSL